MRRVWLVTVATQTQLQLGYLLASAALAGWPPESVVVLGVGNPGMQPGQPMDYCVKTREVRAWVRSATARRALAPEDLVLYADAYDALVQDGPAAAVQAWEALGSPPLVFSADRWCYPPDQAVEAALTARAAPGDEYRYVCAGAYAGTAAAFLDAFDAYPGIGEPGDDQGRWAQAMTDGSAASAAWTLDRTQTLMASVTGDGRARALARARPRGVPILHLNGYDNKPLLGEAFARLAAGRPTVLLTPPPLPTVDLVVARFAEDVGGCLPAIVAKLRARPDLKLRDVVVYDKGSGNGAPGVAWPALEPAPQLVRLRNVGQEAHSYAVHVLRCWDSPNGLPDVTLCLPGSVAHGGDQAELMHRALAAPFASPWDAAPLVPWSDVAGWSGGRPDEERGAPAPSPLGFTTLAEWAAGVLHLRPPADAKVPMPLCGVVALTRAAARAWPRATWRALAAELAVANNPLSAHFMERLWGVVCAGDGAPGAALLPKTIWMLWLQGWHTAPPLVWDVRATWERLNPSWKVQPLDAASLTRLVGPAAVAPGAHAAAVSDMARLLLLARFGGVWVDATTACFRPLEEWVHCAVRPCGVWMHRSPQRGLAPALCLMAALPGSLFVASWLHAALSVWLSRSPGVPDSHDFSMTRLLLGLLAHNKDMRQAWLALPGRTAEGEGEAHCVAGRVHADADPALLRQLVARKPFGVKLCWRGPHHPHSNGAAVVRVALAGGGVTDGDDFDWEPAPTPQAAQHAVWNNASGEPERTDAADGAQA